MNVDKKIFADQMLYVIINQDHMNANVQQVIQEILFVAVKVMMMMLFAKKNLNFCCKL